MKYLLIILITLSSCGTMDKLILTDNRIERNCEVLIDKCVDITPDTIFYNDTAVSYFDTIIYDTIRVDADTVYLRDTVVKGFSDTLVSILTFSEATAYVNNFKIYLNHVQKDTAIIIVNRLDSLIKEVNYYKELAITKDNVITIEKDSKFGGFTKNFFYTIIIVAMLAGILKWRKIW